MSGRRYLRYTFSLRQFLAGACLLARMLLFGNFALMFLILKLFTVFPAPTLATSRFRICSLPMSLCPLFVNRLLDTEKRAFV